MMRTKRYKIGLTNILSSLSMRNLQSKILTEIQIIKILKHLKILRAVKKSLKEVVVKEGDLINCS